MEPTDPPGRSPGEPRERPGEGSSARAPIDSGAAPPVVRPDWAAPAHVRAFCTTRAGGVSAPPYDTLNVGLHVGDDADAVAENRRRVAAALGLPAAPLWLVQVHGAVVVRAGAPATDAPSGTGAASGTDGTGGADGAGEATDGAAPEADGAWTDAPGRVLAVMTADCLPVVATDATGSRVAVAHAGWRGLAGGVLEAALAPFDAATPLHVWLGPAIGPRAFEVGAEVREAFVRRDAAHEAAFAPGARAGKYLADLYALARGEIARARPDGDVRTSGGERCTLTERAAFHSHRRDGARSGRMATYAWLDAR